ncbi:ABC transporter permease [Pontibacter cellulosilyticus]|uniref:ABC transporter permease n=1 Tax=Pontibacter cellulosilyticus TaxID=1720253 RepID=A0A923N2V7_9BACT|nr:ABC transporter permease [Pontibacter cellulosilyticus]MBC5991221.1 ABC transporter permease [Pontibacter cellulosilyticus]
MLKNYLKIAWKVLLRRKFFTFISLFGISFTLMILMVATAMVNHLFGPENPELKTDRMLYVNRLKMTGNGYTMNSNPGYYILDKYVRPLKTPQDMTFYTSDYSYNAYVNNRKLPLDVRFTDSNFWNVLDFEFVEGQPFSKGDVDGISRVAVINEATRQNYFGNSTNALGKFIEVDRTKYKVVGVVKNVAANRLYTYADVWLPYTNIKEDYRKPQFGGSFEAIILANSPSDIDNIKEEFNQAFKNVIIPGPDAANYKSVYLHADTLVETYIRGVTSAEGEISITMFFTWVTLGVLFFMLLPTINLVNINISRIIERASEIGVRKAFGASSATLVGQFLVENMILTLIGGALGLLLAQGVLAYINSSGIIPYSNLAINPTIFAYSFLICIVFGFLSGVYPAFKMSKLHVVAALKGGNV